jgi:hypothetical protein
MRYVSLYIITSDIILILLFITFVKKKKWLLSSFLHHIMNYKKITMKKFLKNNSVIKVDCFVKASIHLLYFLILPKTLFIS